MSKRKIVSSFFTLKEKKLIVFRFELQKQLSPSNSHLKKYEYSHNHLFLNRSNYPFIIIFFTKKKKNIYKVLRF